MLLRFLTIAAAGWSMVHAEPDPASAMLPASCEVARPAARKLFESRHFTVETDALCGVCLHLQSKRLHDASGHTIMLTETAIKRYMSRGIEGRNPPGFWISHSPVHVEGSLRLEPEGTGCKAQLLFHYFWYATEFLVIVPVDGDPASRPSNLRLEQEYLPALRMLQ